jgi:hypothetical protein
MSMGWPENLTMTPKNIIKKNDIVKNPFISSTLTFAKEVKERIGVWHGLC